MKKSFAELDSSGVVLRVVIAQSQEWCEQHLGGKWIETFKDGSKRFNYAGPGWLYDEEKDAFIPPKPYPSWVLNSQSFVWEPPVPQPADMKNHVWDEEAGNWVEMEA